MSIWRHFNRFLIRLDNRPDNWEDRTSLFCAFLIKEGLQSQTIKCYISAIKAVLKEDNYQWDDNKALLGTMIRACQLQNDHMRLRLPIQKGLLELILFELKRVLKDQYYLQIIYRALFCLAYYGLMRIGELTQSSHVVKAKDIHIGQNKDKILVILYSSKTHGKESYPQKIKISAERRTGHHTADIIFCPFEAIRTFVAVRGGYTDQHENFFVFRDKGILLSEHVRKILKK